MNSRSRPLTLPLIAVILTGALGTVYTSLAQATHVDNANVVVSLQPACISAGVGVGSTFSVKFNIANVNDMDGWEFTIVFDPTTVNVLPSSAYVYEGFTSPATDPLTVKRAITLDNEFGTVAAGATAFPLPASGITGSGALFRLDFSVVTVPTAPSPIEFFDLLLRSVTPAEAIEIITPVSVGSGFCEDLHCDLEIAGTPASLTIVQGSSGTSTITVFGLSGVCPSTFSLTAAISPILANGPTLSLNPATVSLGGVSTLSVSTNSATPLAPMLLLSLLPATRWSSRSRWLLQSVHLRWRFK